MAAVLTAEGGAGYISWLIEDLQSDFTDEFYLGCGICTGEVEPGSKEDPSGILHYVDAKSSTLFGNMQPGTVRNLEPGVYEIYGFTQTPSGQYWNVWPAEGNVPLVVVVKGNSLSIDPWDWDSSNGDATATETSRAHSILNGNRPASDGFAADVWNDLVYKVWQMRDELGFTWDTAQGEYLTRDECYVSPGDTLSAAIYNSVRYQVGAVRGTGISDRAPGDEVLGYHIIHMVDVLNDIIENP